MNYFNNPYSQQAFNGQMIQPSMLSSNYNPYNYSQQMYGNIQPQQNMNYAQQQQRVDFQGVIVSSFDEVKSYPVPLGGTILLLNKSANKFYLKSLGDNGVPIIETYDFSVTNMSNVEKETVNKEDIVESFNRLNNKVTDLTNRMNAYEKNINLSKN